MQFNGSRASYRAILKFLGGQQRVSGLIFCDESPWFEIKTDDGWKIVKMNDFVIKETKLVTITQYSFSTRAKKDLDLTSVTIVK